LTDKATGTPAAALRRGAPSRRTLAATRALRQLHVERHGTTFVVPLVGNSRQRYSVLRFTREPS